MDSTDESFRQSGVVVPEKGSGVENSGGIIAAYPYRSNFSASQWWDLIQGTNQRMDLLGYTLYFLPLEHPGLIDSLRAKCESGCKIRACIAHPKSEHVHYRDTEENQPITLVLRIHSTLKYFAPLLDCPNFELRFQDIPLYNSVFRFDNEMLVTPHLFATIGASAPLLHLKNQGPNALFARFDQHFNDVWSSSKPYDPMEA